MGQVKPTADIVEMSVGALFEWDGLEACYEFVQDALSVPALEIVKVHAAKSVQSSISDVRGVEFNATGMVQKRLLDIRSVRDFQKKFADYVQSEVHRSLTPENDNFSRHSESPQLSSTAVAEVECIPGPPHRLGFDSKLPPPIQALVHAPIRKALGAITNGREGGNLSPLPKAKQSWRSKERKRPLVSAQGVRGHYVPPAKRARRAHTDEVVDDSYAAVMHSRSRA
ncbi:uncharacterized protein STEHIDRAFT_121633 [Stereum hirsutum FP-91666 SS1]|uniref:uncharacterized protein n=1 Tax=Stereum hirsutum (strain FP-91666) TaxID=721885 RepID=UPI000444986F|nr:uncharacterized protein STEHIDRAFT_121633 [Stereum hirsutum FP-91666 SS1]EIM86786.1 hypothetical protein STEHIDRAFT_121633 [Stereum hirsutum FP-91666 SS1]